MSLINDALKRARQNRPVHSVARQPDPTLSPADHGRRRSAPLLVLFASILTALAGAWLVWKWAQGTPQIETRAQRPESQTESAQTQTAQIEPDADQPLVASSPEERVDPASNTLPTPERAVAGEQNKASNPEQAVVREPGPAEGEPLAQAASLEQSIAVIESPQAPVVFPELKLQGIFYRLHKPSALINNRTVYVGEEIEGVRLVAVQRFSVKLQLGNEVKELSMR